jgi:hypothetical protein
MYRIFFGELRVYGLKPWILSLCELNSVFSRGLGEDLRGDNQQASDPNQPDSRLDRYRSKLSGRPEELDGTREKPVGKGDKWDRTSLNTNTCFDTDTQLQRCTHTCLHSCN